MSLVQVEIDSKDALKYLADVKRWLFINTSLAVRELRDKWVGAIIDGEYWKGNVPAYSWPRWRKGKPWALKANGHMFRAIARSFEFQTTDVQFPGIGKSVFRGFYLDGGTITKNLKRLAGAGGGNGEYWKLYEFGKRGNFYKDTSLRFYGVSTARLEPRGVSKPKNANDTREPRKGVPKIGMISNTVKGIKGKFEYTVEPFQRAVASSVALKPMSISKRSDLATKYGLKYTV